MITEAFGGKIFIGEHFGTPKNVKKCCNRCLSEGFCSVFFSVLLYLARGFSKREYVRFG